MQLCGDAHVANFGMFASPERDLVFDLNDFDETLPGPFEDDVARLVASVVVAARAMGLGRRERRAAALAAGSRYRRSMARFAGQRDLEVWYSRIDADELRTQLAPHLARGQRKRLARALRKATPGGSAPSSGRRASGAGPAPWPGPASPPWGRPTPRG